MIDAKTLSDARKAYGVIMSGTATEAELLHADNFIDRLAERCGVPRSELAAAVESEAAALDPKTELMFKVWFVGSNMPGYMPDEPPHPCASEESARESLLWDIGRDIDAASDAGHDVTELERFYQFCQNVEDVDQCGGTVGGRYYFISSGAMTGSELTDCDCDLTEYEPILDRSGWIDASELDALHDAGFDVELLECQIRHCEEWKTVRIIDDWGMSGRPWLIGKTDCGAWLFPDATIRADSFSSAYEAWIDERPTIAPEDVPDAYNAFDRFVEYMESRGHEDTLHLRQFCSANAAEFFRLQTSNGDNWDVWELGEGYTYQSNASGTGIVDTGFDERLDEIADCDIRFRVKL